MRHDRHSVMQASIRRRIALKHGVPTAKCGLMHACAWRRHDYYWASVTASRANPFHSMGGRPSHQTKVGHIAGSHVETSGQIMSLMAFSCNLSWPRKDNDFFFLFLFLCRCIFYLFLFYLFTFNSLNSCQLIFSTDAALPYLPAFTAVHDLPPPVSYDTHTKN